jgi:molecular chaperone GrpE
MTPDPEEDVGDPLDDPTESQSVAEDPDAVRAKAAERDEYLDRLKRTMAEFQNYKSRVGREKTDLRKFVTAEVVRAFLPVLDNLERAVAAAKDETDRGPRPSAAKAGVEDRGPRPSAAKAGVENPLLDGVRMVIGEFQRRLEQLGVKPVQTDGARFDPSQMEAVLRVDDSDAEENSVLDVFEKGYRLDDFVIRHARVSVAGAKPGTEAVGSEGPEED